MAGSGLLKVGTWVLMGVACASAGFVAGRTLPASDDSDTSRPVVRYEGGALTEAELRSHLERTGGAERAAPDVRRELVERLVLEEVQASRARVLGYDRLPETRSVCDRVLAQAYREREFEAKSAPRSVSDDELRKAFEERKPELSRPEHLQLAFMYFEKGSKPADARARAARASAEARAAQAKTPTGFTDTVRLRSEEPRSAAVGGELPYMSAEALRARLGEAVVAAAGGLKVGDISEPVDAEAGFYVVRLLGRTPAVQPSLDAVGPRLQTHVLAQKREAAEKRWERSLLDAARVEVDEAAMNATFEEAAKLERTRRR